MIVAGDHIIMISNIMGNKMAAVTNNVIVHLMRRKMFVPVARATEVD
jgi:hypothetical protein